MESGVRLEKCQCCGSMTSYRCYDCNDPMCICPNCAYSCFYCHNVICKICAHNSHHGVCIECRGRNIKGAE